MSSSNKASAGNSGQRSSLCRRREVNRQDQNGPNAENSERPVQGEEHRDRNSSEDQTTNVSQHDTWGFEAMDKKPQYEGEDREKCGLSLTASEEETARQPLGNRDGFSGFQGSSALEDWQRKPYTHEQWWNRR